MTWTPVTDSVLHCIRFYVHQFRGQRRTAQSRSNTQGGQQISKLKYVQYAGNNGFRFWTVLDG